MDKDYNFGECEVRWNKYWDGKKVYRFDPKSKKPIFSIDTPPPTVSGKMHIGHAFSYAQQDFVARYHRMKGESVFYPFGTDDNGLPTERLVEKLKNVRASKMPRDEFIKLCLVTLEEIGPSFVQDWKNIGVSCDFNLFYSTINDHCRRISQKSFIDLYNGGRAYRKEAPTIWCPECQTAIAQVELEDKELDSTFNDVNFMLENGGKIIIATTRPELLPACVCVYVHPEDSRYKKLVGKELIVPLFKQRVPVFADESADPEKGSGVLMVCTWGDRYDVEAAKKRKLQPRVVLDRDGRMNGLAGKYKGLTIKEARRSILKDLESEGLLIAKKSIKHTVNVHERCGTEIEFLATSQWFINYLDLKDKFLECGRRIKWYPEFMIHRYENWVKGLLWDWCISRQRYFGVPFPVWYCKECGAVILADEKDLPMDPLFSSPKKPCKCGSKEFIPEKDVLDTWATSSLTPQIAIQLVKDKKVRKKLFPMSLRAQAHEIISFWAFNTVVKSYFHENNIPWENIMISGFVTLEGEKMAKSKGNVVEPQIILQKYGADCLRFWAASSKLGEDFDYQEKEFVAAKKFVTKLWNASKFCFMHLQDYDCKKPKNLELIDKWLLIRLNELVRISTESFESYEYSKTKAETENFFWHTFCDNYLEIIKDRLYNSDKYGEEAKLSAQYTLYNSLLTIIKLMAPITPYITEEVYQMYYAKNDKHKSIHVSEWPKFDKKLVDKKLENLGDEAIDMISKVRQFKSANGKSLKEPVKVTLPNSLKPLEADLKAVLNASELDFGKEFKVSF